MKLNPGVSEIRGSSLVTYVNFTIIAMLRNLKVFFYRWLINNGRISNCIMVSMCWRRERNFWHLIYSSFCLFTSLSSIHKSVKNVQELEQMVEGKNCLKNEKNIHIPMYIHYKNIYYIIVRSGVNSNRGNFNYINWRTKNYKKRICDLKDVIKEDYLP